MQKKSITKKPEREISQTKCNYGCVYYEKDFANNLGDWTTSFGGTKEIPKAEAKFSE